MREYAFDVKMFAIVRVLAETRAKAEEILSNAINRAELKLTDLSGKRLHSSISVDDEAFPYLVEVDGIDVDNDESEVDDFEISG